MPRNECSEAAGAWARRWGRALASEAAGTALLVWLGVAATLPAALPAGAGPALPFGAGPAPPLGNVAAAFGGVVAGCGLAFGAASGAHLNPAVSLAAALAGRLPPLAALGYALAQLLGATLGFAALLHTLPAPKLAGVTLPATAVDPLAACALEAALTGLLALACLALWAAEAAGERDPAAPVKLGLLVAGLVCAGGAASGASLNPARSFAPALLHAHWQHHWVYWVGPLGGAALASALHAALRTRPTRPARARAEELALDDKP